MSSIRNNLKKDQSSSSVYINNSERDKQKLHRSKDKLTVQHSTSQTQQTQSTINNPPPENDDCFIKFGIVSSSEEKDQPVHLVEEIDAITALIIYNTYSKKHEFTLSPQHRARTATIPNYIRDDIDRFDALYSCLIDQSSSSRNNPSKTSNPLNKALRNRFYTLSNVDQLRTFQQNEQSRIYEEKQAKLNRVPFIPNILSYQRTCPDYNLDELKWIRDHLC